MGQRSADIKLKEAMTEAEWLALTDPGLMLTYLDRMYYLDAGVTDRKLRLFACACCRRIWHMLDEAACKKAVEVAERFADGEASKQEMENARAAAWDAGWDSSWSAFPPAWAATSNVHEAAAKASETARHGTLSAERHEQARLLQDIFGHLFSPLADDPALLRKDPSVVALAKQIYEGRAFDLMPQVGDLLMESGCDNQSLLAHCHSQNQHVRGCWVIDLLLGKG